MGIPKVLRLAAMTELNFKGSGALVSGAGGGIGQQIAQDLLSAGINVLALDLKDPPEYDCSNGASLIYRQVDMTDATAVSAAVSAASSGLVHDNLSTNAARAASGSF